MWRNKVFKRKRNYKVLKKLIRAKAKTKRHRHQHHINESEQDRRVMSCARVKCKSKFTMKCTNVFLLLISTFSFLGRHRNNKIYYGKQCKTEAYVETTNGRRTISENVKTVTFYSSLSSLQRTFAHNFRFDNFNCHSVVLSILFFVFLIRFASLDLDLVHGIYFFVFIYFVVASRWLESMWNGIVLILICKMTTASVGSEEYFQHKNIRK